MDCCMALRARYEDLNGKCAIVNKMEVNECT